MEASAADGSVSRPSAPTASLKRISSNRVDGLDRDGKPNGWRCTLYDGERFVGQYAGGRRDGFGELKLEKNGTKVCRPQSRNQSNICTAAGLVPAALHRPRRGADVADAV